MNEIVMSINIEKSSSIPPRIGHLVYGYHSNRLFLLKKKGNSDCNCFQLYFKVATWIIVFSLVNRVRCSSSSSRDAWLTASSGKKLIGQITARSSSKATRPGTARIRLSGTAVRSTTRSARWIFQVTVNCSDSFSWPRARHVLHGSWPGPKQTTQRLRPAPLQW